MYCLHKKRLVLRDTYIHEMYVFSYWSHKNHINPSQGAYVSGQKPLLTVRGNVKAIIFCYLNNILL